MKRITACTLDCPDTCSFVVETDDQGNDFIRGNPDHPFTNGFTCAKTPKAFPARLRHPDRITRPLLKKDKNFVPVTWNEALDICAAKIGELRRAPETMLHLRGYGYRGALALASMVFWAALGSSKAGGSVCDDTGIDASILDFGSLNHNEPADLANAGRIVNWGRDLARSSIHLGTLVQKARRNGTRVLTISPGGDGHESWSDDFIRVRPGTDRFLAAAVIRLMMNRGLIRPEITDYASNWPAFSGLLQDRSWQDLAAEADVSPADAEKVLDWYKNDVPVSSILAIGLQRYRHGAENVCLIDALALLTRQMGRPGAGVYYNILSRRNLADWAPTSAPGRREFPLHDLGPSILAADPPVRMIWVDGLNAVNQLPNGPAVAQALEKAELTVVSEAFMTDTALRADLILPCTLMMEEDEILGSSMHNYVNFSARAFDPPGEARLSFHIMADLGARLDPPIEFPPAEECLRRAVEDSPYLKVGLEELKAAGFVRAERDRIAFAGMNFDHPDGRFRFVETLTPEPSVNQDWPLNLLTLVDRKYLNSQIPEEDQTGPVVVTVSAELPGAHPGPARLVTPHGTMDVEACLSDDLHPGAVVVRRGGWMKCGVSVNPIIGPLVTDLAGGIAYYSQTARVDF